MINNRLKFTSLLLVSVVEGQSLGLSFESTGFRSQQREASMSCHTDEF